MRLLVVGGSSLMAWVVRHVVPDVVEVEHVTTFPAVQEAFRRGPPQAALFIHSASPFPWAETYDLCRRGKPPVPTLSHAYFDPKDLDIPEETRHIFNEQLPASALGSEIGRLIRAAESASPESTLTPPREEPGFGTGLLRAVLDANVFVRMILSRKPEGVASAIRYCLEEGAFQLVTSAPLLTELRRTLLQRDLAETHGWTDRQIEEYVASLREIAIIVPGTSRIELPALEERDPTDVPLVVAAVEGKADVIVTQDADLLDDPSLGDYPGLGVVDPLDFLKMLRSRMADS